MSIGRCGRIFLVSIVALLGLARPLFAAPVSPIELDNGLRLYLKPVAADAKTIDLRLIVHFGAVDEKQGEYGWAHLVEHMAFSGTEHFSVERIRNLYNRANVRFGRDVNAATGERHTVYQLTVPDGDLDLLQENLELMADWLSSMHFAPAALARQKQVIAAEALESNSPLKASLGWRELLLAEQASEHEAIGVMAQVRRATPESLHAFWRRGYRPDNATVLLTGDFVPEAVMARVQATLARVQAPAKPRQIRLSLPLAKPQGVLVTQSRDRIESQVMVARVARGTEQIQQVSVAMMALQWQLERNEQPSCGEVQRRMESLHDGSELHYVVQRAHFDSELSCLAGMTQAVLRLRSTGLEAESFAALFHRAQSHRQSYAALERKAGVQALADQLEERLIKSASVQTAAERLAETAVWMSGQEQAEVNRVIAQALDPKGLSLVLQSVAEALPDSDQLAALWTGGEQSMTPPLAGVVYPLATPRAQVAVEAVEGGEGQLTLRYANGAQVHMLVTDNVRDHFDVLLVREGGLLSLPSPLVSAAAQLPVVLPLRGLGNASAEELRAGIRDHKLSFSWFVDNFRQGIRASAREQGAEALFSLLYQAHRPLPGGDSAGHRVRLPPVSEATRDAGQRQLRRVVWRTLYDLGDPPRPPVPSTLREADTLAAHSHLFNGGSGLQVYIAGGFDLQKMRGWVDRYMGALPPSPRPHSVPDLYASAKRQRIVHQGNSSGRADLSFYYVQSAPAAWEHLDAELLLMRELLAQRLWSELREHRALVYDVGVQLLRRTHQRGGISLQVSMVCDPRSSDEVRHRVDEVLLSLLVEGVDDAELAPLKHRLAADYQALLKDNAALLDEWASQRARGGSLAQVQRTAADIESMDAQRLVQFTRRFFKSTGFLEVKVVPGLHNQSEAQKPVAFISP